MAGTWRRGTSTIALGFVEGNEVGYNILFVIVFLMVPGGSDGCSWTTMAVDEDDEGEKDDSEADAVWRSPSMPLCFL